MTLVVITHEMQSAFIIADRIALMHAGRFLVIDVPEVVRQSQDPIVRRFLDRKPPAPTDGGEKFRKFLDDLSQRFDRERSDARGIERERLSYDALGEERGDRDRAVDLSRRLRLFGDPQGDELAVAHREIDRRNGLRSGRVRLARVLDRDDGTCGGQGVTFTLLTISSDHAFE